MKFGWWGLQKAKAERMGPTNKLLGAYEKKLNELSLMNTQFTWQNGTRLQASAALVNKVESGK